MFKGYWPTNGFEYGVQTLEKKFLANFSLGDTTRNYLTKVTRKLDLI
jgi:hypothetical protein